MTTDIPSARLGVFIGRFQPYHAGHHHVITSALDQVDHLLVLLGSAHQPRSVRNPLSTQERANLILACLDENQKRRITLMPLADSCDDVSAWVASVHQQANAVYQDRFGPIKENIVLVGHKKDNTSYYLDLFPNWDSVGIDPMGGHENILSATPLRDRLFGPSQFWDKFLQANEHIKVKPFLDQAVELYRPHALTWLDSNPEGVLPGTVPLLRQFVLSEGYEEPCREAAYARHFRFPWRHSPYPPIFVTADPVVFHGDSVLLVRRADYPGRGLWAIPGGFVEEMEPIFEAALRELAEETALGMDKDQLRGLCFFHKTYDSPFRSVRGRVIDHAYGFRLPSDQPRPPAQMNEESMDLAWVNIATLRSDQCFEDHYAIIHRFYREMRKQENS